MIERTRATWLKEVLRLRSDKRKVELASKRLLRVIEGGRGNLDEAVMSMRRALLEVQD